MLGKLEDKFPSLRSRILEPLAFEVNPDYISFAGLLTAFASGLLFSRDMYVVASLAILLSGYLDILDGYVASKIGETLRGDFIDHTFDRVADVAILTGISVSSAVSITLGFATVVSVLLVSYLGTQAQAVTGERVYSGLMGRSDRMVVLAVTGFLMAFESRALYAGVSLILVLSVLTFFQRFVEIMDRLDS